MTQARHFFRLAAGALLIAAVWTAPAHAVSDFSPSVPPSEVLSWPPLDLSTAAEMTSLTLRATSALVLDPERRQAIYAKNIDEVRPIASITKLMTAMVVLDAGLNLDEAITIVDADVDTLRYSSSRLPVGATLTRREMMRLALMSSENRAAAALGRSYPGGIGAFVMAMNRKAAELGMRSTRFADSTGLSAGNVSTARDLARLVQASSLYDLIHEYTTTPAYTVGLPGYGIRHFSNTNSLSRDPSWDIQVSKTGYIREAGKCLVMEATIQAKKVVIVLLDSSSGFSRIGDARNIKAWMETGVDHRNLVDPPPRIMKVRNSRVVRGYAGAKAKTKYVQKAKGKKVAAKSKGRIKRVVSTRRGAAMGG